MDHSLETTVPYESKLPNIYEKKDRPESSVKANQIIGSLINQFQSDRVKYRDIFNRNNILFYEYVDHWIWKNQKNLSKEVLLHLTENLNFNIVKNKYLIGKV